MRVIQTVNLCNRRHEYTHILNRRHVHKDIFLTVHVYINVCTHKTTTVIGSCPPVPRVSKVSVWTRVEGTKSLSGVKLESTVVTLNLNSNAYLTGKTCFSSWDQDFQSTYPR